MWCFESKTWSDFSEILLGTLPSCTEFVKFCVFSEILENNRPNVALTVKFVEF